MEMENSRRPPFDRSIMKKPKLNEDQSHGVLQQYMQHQELINQYKTALAELTVNSKPIITNLTIIAGENLQAAKAIAATICCNIIEVPSEHKLPSLYLLDSIVKNIGRDYIKCFAARLPEVFCKAYRQVDPSIHRGMRHLFGTWRGVFPPQTLQVVEKELGFQAASSGPSSGSATSKSDPQSQQQPNSIHVNPKYLEIRGRLQQSKKPLATNIGRVDVESSEHVGTPQRTASAVRGRPWTNLALKKQTVHPPWESSREFSFQQQGDGGYGLVRPSGTLAGIPGGISAGGNIPSMQSSPRKRSSAEISTSWKTSEEEEYLWDDLDTGVTNPYAVCGANKEFCSSDGPEKSDLGGYTPKWQSEAEVRSSFERETSADTLSSEQKGHIPVGRSSPWEMHEPCQVDYPRPLLQQVGTYSVPSFGLQTAVSESKGSMGQRRPSPGQSPMHQRSPSPSLSKRDPRQHFAEKSLIKSHALRRSDPRTASIPGKLTVGLHDKSVQNSMPARGHNLQSGSSGQSNVSTLLAAVMKTGLLSGNSVSQQPSVEAPPTAPIMSLAAVMTSKGPVTSLGLSHNSATPSFHQVKAETPLVPGSPPSSSPMSIASAQDSDAANGNSNQLTSLFSSLLARGLISSSKTEPMPPVSMISEDQIKEGSPTMATEGPITVETAPKTSVFPRGPSTDKLAMPELDGKQSENLAQSMKVEVASLIGFEFKPHVLRELHQEVIDRLTDEVPHRCAACGLRFKLKEQLDRHTQHHTFRSSVTSSLNKPSRRWYSHSADWVAGESRFPFGYRSSSFMESSCDTSEIGEVVRADESQCVCLLCGELFEDFYSQERDEWMFRGAIYVSVPWGSSDFIAHPKCSSEYSVSQLKLGH